LESAGIIHSRQAKKARFAIGLTNLSEMNNERHRSFIPKKIKSDEDNAYNRYVNSDPISDDDDDDWALEEYQDYMNRKHPLQHIDDARNKLTINGGDNLRIIEMGRKGKGWLRDSKPKLKFYDKIHGKDGPDIRYRMMNNYQTAKKITALATAGGLGAGALIMANRKKDATPSSSGRVNKSIAKRAKKEPICDCGKPISQCQCNGHNHKSKRTIQNTHESGRIHKTNTSRNKYFS
jgi:hypothetical protein